VPSCTEDRSGFLRVRTCAAARAIENQCYVLHAPTVGWLWSVPTAALHYGQASVLGPCDLGFARDGVLAEGPLGVESLVVADLDIAQLDRVREMGTVRTLRDSAASDALAATITVESIA
jgi:predicted amidohydrolase